jgi:thiol-disulfide isomerase/thioredoxin
MRKMPTALLNRRRRRKEPLIQALFPGKFETPCVVSYRNGSFLNYLLILCASLLLPLLAPAEPDTGWTTDFDKTLHNAAESGHPLLLDFSATWCGPCQMMARTTLQESNVVQKMGSFLKVKVDIDANAALAERFGIHAVPTFVVVNGDGEEIARTTGMADAASFDGWLNGALSTAAFSAARKESFQKEKETLARELTDANPNAKDKAVEMLLDYSFRKEKYYRDFAEANLKTAARNNPALFLDFLNHQKLAVRILAANLLRDQLGNDFVFDPWANATVRTVVIDKWRTRLAAKKD